MTDTMTATVTTTVTGLSPMESFAERLTKDVEAAMEKLESANAVDEWHGAVLDDFIDESVAQERTRIEREAIAERTHWAPILAVAEQNHKATLATKLMAEAGLERASDALRAAEELLYRSQAAAVAVPARAAARPRPTVLGRFGRRRPRRGSTSVALGRALVEREAALSDAEDAYERARRSFYGTPTNQLNGPR